jgi:hypothetical protein
MVPGKRIPGQYHVLTAKPVQPIGPPNLQTRGPTLDVVSLIPGKQLASLSGIASMCCATISTTGMVFCGRALPSATAPRWLLHGDDDDDNLFRPALCT